MFLVIFTGIVLTFTVLPFLIPLLAWSWRTLLLLAVLGLGPLAWVWIDHVITISKPRFDGGGGPGEAMGPALFFVVTLGFSSGLVTRAVALAFKSRNPFSGRSLLIATAGAVSTMGLFSAPLFYDKWDRRRPDRACMESGINIYLADARITVPIVPIFNIYLGSTVGKDAFYFSAPEHVRELCRRGRNGKLTVKAAMIAIRFDEVLRRTNEVCGLATPRWLSERCALADPTGSAPRSLGRPLNAYIFVPGQVTLGEFFQGDAGFGPAPAKGEAPPYSCRPAQNHSYCNVSYIGPGGTHIAFDVYADTGHEVDAVARAYDEMTGIVDELTGTPTR